jgi:hypothetical protein
MARLGLIGLYVALGACAQEHVDWMRVDGRTDTRQLELDQIVCRGEANKANRAAGNDKAIAPEIFGYSSGMRAVFDGCMAQRGYKQKSP